MELCQNFGTAAPPVPKFGTAAPPVAAALAAPRLVIVESV